MSDPIVDSIHATVAKVADNVARMNEEIAQLREENTRLRAEVDRFYDQSKPCPRCSW